MIRYLDPETGFLYLRARYYDPKTAQFLTPDPLFALTGERYGYASNDPINGSDPTGMCGFLGNGPCTPGGIAKEATNDTVKIATGGQANCVRYVTCSARTKSLASEHKTTTKLLYLTLGVSATVASGGLLAESASALAAGEGLSLAGGLQGLATVGAGGIAAGGDFSQCFHEHDQLACAGFWMGTAGAGLGAAGLLPGEVGLGFGAFGLVAGMGAGFVDLAAMINTEANQSGCP